MYGEILRYMGHKGAADTIIKKLISSCLEKLAMASTPRYVIKSIPCIVCNEKSVMIDTLAINSRSLSEHLSGCEYAYVMAATLGICVDRLISQRAVVDALEALCLQACATVEIEKYCDSIEKKLVQVAFKNNLHITSRFSPGYGDFDIAYQHDILQLLNAQKKIGVTETKSYMLSPLKTVTAIIGVKPLRRNKGTHSASSALNKCINCKKTDCEFRTKKGN